MERRVGICSIVLGLGFTIVLAGRPATATLGEPAGSAFSDRKPLSAANRASVIHPGYTIREYDNGGNMMREFVNQSGIVFAVAWSGLSHPDLTPLLGSYAGEYREALAKTPRERGKRHIRVEANRVVVEKWGHMRSAHGRAYIPALLPSGVNIDEIK